MDNSAENKSSEWGGIGQAMCGDQCKKPGERAVK